MFHSLGATTLKIDRHRFLTMTLVLLRVRCLRNGDSVMAKGNVQVLKCRFCSVSKKVQEASEDQLRLKYLTCTAVLKYIEILVM